MKRLIVFSYALLFLIICRSDNDIKNEEIPEDFSDNLEESIVNIETTASNAERIIREGILPKEEAEMHYNKIVDDVEDIIELIKEPSHAYSFVRAKGIDRIFMPNISVKNPKLRVSLLMLLKMLFDLLPTTTDAVVPIYAIDKLVDIFDNDDNLGIKAHALDILSVWLVGNPKAQLRVIKMKGLDPFYRQIHKLSQSVTITLLELFNTILEEHIEVRNYHRQRSKADSDKLVLYQRMGLIERVSTTDFCEGLLNIFYTTWTHTSGDVPLTILKLVKNTLPYCWKVHKGQDRAIKLFDALREHVSKNDMYQGFSDLNLTDIKEILDSYVRNIKHEAKDKDEF